MKAWTRKRKKKGLEKGGTHILGNLKESAPSTKVLVEMDL
jgi:hypothetical protein